MSFESTEVSLRPFFGGGTQRDVVRAADALVLHVASKVTEETRKGGWAGDSTRDRTS